MPKTALIAKDNIETDFSSEIIEIELPGGTRGLQGEKGPQGDTGKTPNFHIGSVSDTETAVASITGTTDDPVLNLGLPKGKSGVWVGPSEPVDEQYNVWVNPEGPAGTIPTKVSELENDTGFITDADVPTKTSDLTNDSGFITSSSLPTKTSDLTNDSGFITTNDIPKDVYSYQETLTNKVYVDSNNVQHPVYRKMFTVDLTNLSDVTVWGGTYKGFAHNISNFGKLISSSSKYSDEYGVQSTDSYFVNYEMFYTSGFGNNSEYIFFLGEPNIPSGLLVSLEITLEYTKEEV